MSSIRRCLALATVLTAVSAAPALASTHTWTGAGGNGNWSTATNWSGNVAPTTGEPGGTVVQFGASTTTTMNLPGLVVDEVHFTGTGNTIAGASALGVSGAVLVNNVVDDAGGNAITAPIALTGGSTIFAAVAAGQLTLSGTVSGSVGFRVIGATASSGITLTGNNTYTGTTTVRTGTLTLNSNGSDSAVTGSSILVGLGGGDAAAALRLLQSTEIADTTNVTVAANGTFDTGGHSEIVNGVTVTDGTVALAGTGFLQLGAPLTMTGGSVTSATSTTQLRLFGNLVATSSATSTATIGTPVALDGARTLTVSDGPQADDLSITAPLVDGVVTPSSLIKAGAGTLALTGSSGNTYTGATTIQDGVVTTNHSTGVGIPGNLTIGDGTGAASTATLRLLQYSELPQTADVTVAPDGLFDGNGDGQVVNALTVSGGAVALGSSGYLRLNAALTMTGGAITGTAGAPQLLLTGDVAATSTAGAGAVIDARTSLNGPRVLAVADGPQDPDLTVSDAIADGGVVPSSLTKAGAGTLALSGSATNSYTGATTVQTGVLTSNHSIGVGIPGTLTIGTGAGAPAAATVRMLNSSELAPTSDVTVNSDGRLDANGHGQTIHALTVHDGSVATGAVAQLATTGPISVVGGSIDSPVNGRLVPSGGITATSSAAGPATISAYETFTTDQTVTVTPGTAPELRLTGPIGQGGAASGLVKAGAGTLLSTADHTYTGTTTVGAGRFVAGGHQSGPFTVGASGTLSGSGAVGATTVDGVLAPDTGLATGPLTFDAGGRLAVAITSGDPAAAPTVAVTGAVTIDPAATLGATVSPGLTLGAATSLPLISNDATDLISGAFGGAAISSPEGVPLTPSTTGGSGNDLVLRGGNVAPVVGAISATPAAAAIGQAVAFGVGASDVNRDSLTTTWNFGDGATGSGASPSHTYAAAGVFHVVATVSDGIATTQATRDVAVTGPAGGGPGPGSGSGSAASATSSAFGAIFGLASQRTCVKRGATFTATLTVRRAKGKRYFVASVAKVVFTLGRTAKTDRRAPYRQTLRLPATTAKGATVKVGARAFLKLRGGAHRTRALTVKVRACG